MKLHRWSDDEIMQEAQRMFTGRTRAEMRSTDNKLYRAAIRHGLIDRMPWIKETRHRRGHWTEDQVFAESHKYEGAGKIAFRNGSPAAFDKAYKSGWLHRMPWLGELNHHYWNWNELVAASLPYAGKGRKAFCVGNEKAYRYALRKGLLDKMPWLSTKDDPYTDPVWFVYVYRFSDAFYVGITCDKTMRDWAHRTNHHGKSAVFSYHAKSGQPIPDMDVVMHGLRKEEAQHAEDLVRRLLPRTGLRALNVAKTGGGSGSTGSIAHVWTRPRIVEIAKTCKRRSDLKKVANAAYNKARKLGMLDMLFPKDK